MLPLALSFERLEFLIALIWLGGTWLRIYRQARFFQIEEYMSRRYLRWTLAKRSRVLPLRPVGAWLLGLAFASAFASQRSLPALSASLAALVAILPPREAEVKKPLVRTARVKRILFGSFALSSLVFAAALLLEPSLAATSGLGFALFLLAPLWLVGGNMLAQPAEAWLRRRYLAQAASTLAKIQPKIIGITGSYGKTTTKNFLRDILSLRYQTYATPKSYNTLMGICLAINRDLADDYRSECFISEMGAYVEGEIARICQLTPPDIAIITEIGPQHLERFGSLENVKRAKYELVKNLPPAGVAIFNWDNSYIREMIALDYPATRLSVSRELTLAEARQRGLSFIATDIQDSLNGLSFVAVHVPSGERARIETRIIGAHNVTNLLLCIAAAQHEGIALRDIALRCRSLQPAESRLVREKTAAGITIINDAYSANPKGIISALHILRLHETGARLLITPGMIELGPLQDEENYKLGLLAADCATDIILIGQAQTQAIFNAIQATSFDLSRLQVVETLKEAVEWYQGNLKVGDTVLFLNDLPDTY